MGWVFRKSMARWRSQIGSVLGMERVAFKAAFRWRIWLSQQTFDGGSGLRSGTFDGGSGPQSGTFDGRSGRLSGFSMEDLAFEAVYFRWRIWPSQRYFRWRIWPSKRLFDEGSGRRNGSFDGRSGLRSGTFDEGSGLRSGTFDGGSGSRSGTFDGRSGRLSGFSMEDLAVATVLSMEDLAFEAVLSMENLAFKRYFRWRIWPSKRYFRWRIWPSKRYFRWRISIRPSQPGFIEASGARASRRRLQRADVERRRPNIRYKNAFWERFPEITEPKAARKSETEDFYKRRPSRPGILEASGARASRRRLRRAGVERRRPNIRYKNAFWERFPEITEPTAARESETEDFYKRRPSRPGILEASGARASRRRLRRADVERRRPNIRYKNALEAGTSTPSM